MLIKTGHTNLLHVCDFLCFNMSKNPERALKELKTPENME